MLKKIFLFFSLLFLDTAYAGPMVNVEYIHQAINKQWNITVPYNPALQNVRVAANMKYLLTAIDRANEMLNGQLTTDYGNDENYATLDAADTIATDDAVKRLITRKPKFTITTTDNTSNFGLSICASGTFYIDWGDGNTETIERKDALRCYVYNNRHDYAKSGTYKIGVSGLATGYSDTSSTLEFRSSNKSVAAIDGSLGAVFPTIGAGSEATQQPMFSSTFYGCTGLKSIPENLFAGIHGAPRNGMFVSTFSGCTGLKSIPENLFAGIQGAPAYNMFSGTFSGCTGLKSIPENLFVGIKGAPADNMFYGTFDSCTGLTGSIPEKLFAGIQGAPAGYMFFGTFTDCTGLTGGIPEKLFAGIQGAPAYNMFSGTFSGCTGLKSIPENLFSGLQGAPADSMFYSTFANCTGLTGGIPENLFVGIKGAPAYGMFSGTFDSCTGLTGGIPEKLFAGIQGAPATFMFWDTFANCTGLTGSIPENLFVGIKGAPADGMFGYTFDGCTGLTGCIPQNLFAGINIYDFNAFLTSNKPFANTNIDQVLCPVTE